MSDVSTIARRLAEARPEQLLPCPFCAAEVKGENLSKHIDKVHDGGADTGAVVHGTDSMVAIWSVVLAVVIMIVATVGLDVLGLMSRPAAGGLLVLLGLVSIPPVLGFLGKVPASIEVDATGLTLKPLLGRRHLTLPIKIQTGAMIERRPSAVVNSASYSNSPYSDHHAGSYMCFIGANGKKVVAGAKNSTHPRKFWDFEEVQGKKRKRWDVQLKASEIVKLQYLLSEHGVFRPL